MTTARIAAIGKVIRGVGWDKNDATDTKRPDYLPILRAGNIGNDLNTESDLVWVPASNVGSEQRIQAGDIAICMSSGSPAVVGKTASAKVGWPGSVGAFCALIRANPERCLSEYLAFFLKSARFRKWTSESQGANIKNIKKSALEDFEVPVPPLPEQRRIVDLLSRAEGIVRLRREAEKKADELIHALFLDMFGDPAANPKGWPVATIGALTSVQTGATPPRDNPTYYMDAEIPWVKTGEVSGRTIWDTEEKISHLALTDTNCKVFPVGTILVAMYGQGQTRGRCAVLGISAATNQACAAILPSKNILVAFLFCFLKTQYECLRGMAHGGNQANLNLSMIKGLPIILPPLPAQQNFADKLELINSIQSQQTEATAKAQATFDALLSGVFK